MNIALTSQFLTVKAIKKKTQTRFFKNLKVGDTFIIHYKLRRQSAASHGLYSISFTCQRADGKYPDENLTNNEILRALTFFELFDKFYLALRDERKVD